jgi:hypothetical protein
MRKLVAALIVVSLMLLALPATANFVEAEGACPPSQADTVDWFLVEYSDPDLTVYDLNEDGYLCFGHMFTGGPFIRLVHMQIIDNKLPLAFLP